MSGSIVNDGRRRITVVVATAALLGAALGMPSSAGAADTDVQVIVTFKDDPGVAARAALKVNGGTVERSLSLIDGMAVTVPAASVPALRRSPLVESVEIDGQIQAFDHGTATGELEYENAWGVEHIGTRPVHLAGTRGAGVKVAIIDTGLDYVHDLQPSVDPEFLGNYKGGYDFINNDADPMDDNGHGTHVGGIVAAEKNGYLVVGVAPKVDLYALKVLDAAGSGEYSGLIAALGWAVDHDMDVVNMSLGGREVSPALEAAIAAAYDAGITLVAASGNAVTFNDIIYGCPVAYPAAYDQVIAVSFTNTVDRLTGLSCTGPQVDLAAPGDNILSTVPVGSCMFCSPNGFSRQSGTSMASPHVAGVAALVLSHGIGDANSDGLLADDVKAHLCDTAAVGASPAITDPKYATSFGCGIVDADNALVNHPPTGGSTNQPPVAVADTASTAEDGGPLAVDVLANDSDPDAGTSLTVSAVTNPPAGSATIEAGGGSVSYTPDADVNGTDTFGYTIADGDGRTATATVTVTVTPVNDPPDGADDAAGVPEDGSVVIDVLANDTDIDGDALQVKATSDPANGSATVGAGGASVSYSPDLDATGSDTFTYTVDDGAGGTDEATVSVTIGPESDPPIAVDDPVATDEDVSIQIDVLANDSDPDGNPLEITEVSEPSLGTATIEGGVVAYDPDANVSGIDTFTYSITDGAFGTASATVTVDIAAINDKPTASSGVVAVPAATAVVFNLLGSDVETCDLGFSIVSAPTKGTVTTPSAGACTPGSPNKDKASVTYRPGTGFIGTDTFTYKTTDGSTDSSVATVTLNVTAPANAVHVGDLDGSGTVTTTWTAKATIKIHKTNEGAGGGALVRGTWSDGSSGTGTCTTNSSGTCSISKTGIPLTTASVRFTVTNVTLLFSPYLSSMNHDPEGDSNGTTMVIAKP